MRRSKTQDYTGTWSKVQHGLGYIFQNSERFNREVTLLAAYNLAKKAGKSHQQAVDEAIKVNMDAHSHALSEAGPQLFQQGWGKVLTTFKRFAQAQIALIIKLARQVYKGESAEVRSIARKQLTGIFGMAYVFSGLQGMPFYGGAEAVASGLYAALSDDDEPFDLNESVREAFGDLGYKGPLNQLLNVDIASRTGFNGMLWRDDARRLSEVGPLIYATEHLLGPAYSVLYLNPTRALEYMHKGQNERAIETLMPSFIKNGMKGVRFATEGALNSKGVPIVEDINAYSSIMQIFGFTPATLSEAYARAGARKTAEQAINNRKTALLDALYLAKSTGDIEGEMDMYEKIDAFNLRHPEKEISAKSMKRSEDMHEKALTQYTDGVRLDPKLKDYLIETRK
jgi:tetratricopeptide (TPR) repeat protein